jgi:hypothetical protein
VAINQQTEGGMMAYYPTEEWVESLFDFIDTNWNQSLRTKFPPFSFQALWDVAKKHQPKKKRLTVSLGPDYNDFLSELVQNDGIFMLELTDKSAEWADSELISIESRIIVIPNLPNDKTSYIIIEIDGRGYDGSPLSTDYDGFIYNMYVLDESFAREITRLLTATPKYESINNQVIKMMGR